MKPKIGGSKSRKKPEEPKKNESSKLSEFFNRFSTGATKATGSAYAFIMAVVVIIVWGVTGPIFKFSDTWQLVINTGTTIITFLMVFIIQHSQNKDTIAVQLKLDELVAASHSSNKLIGVEDLTDEQLALMKKFYARLSGVSKKENQNKIHSLEEEDKTEAKEKEPEKNKSATPERSKKKTKQNHNEQSKT